VPGKGSGSTAAHDDDRYKVIEKSDSRDLETDQKKTMTASLPVLLNQQKKAHDVLRLIPGLEFE